jgi:hypothetical protein
MYVDLTNNYKLVAVSKRIKRGDQKRVVEATNYSPAYVSRVLNGDHRFNQKILDTTYRLLYRRETIQEKLTALQA